MRIRCQRRFFLNTMLATWAFLGGKGAGFDFSTSRIVRPSPQAAHSVLDRCVHDATLDQIGTYGTSCRVMVLSAVCHISLMPAASGPFRPSITSTATR